MADSDDHVALVFGVAINAGDVTEVARMLDTHPGIAAEPIAVLGGRRPLMVVADWPGYFPNGPQIVRMLVAAGADPNGSSEPGDETPLHWAASSDDVDVAEALLDASADIEAQGSSIAGGAPLENAVGYGCWHVARLLVARGARVEHLWQAAALGLTERVEEFLGGAPPPAPDEITEAFFQACCGGQRRMAEYLLARGAEIDGRPDYSNQSPLEAAGAPDTRRGILVDWLRSQGAGDTGADS